MSYARQRWVGILGALLCAGLCQSALAEEPTSPLAALREAAEAQADTDPGMPTVAASLRDQKAVQKSAAADHGTARVPAQTLRAALRAAAREELQRDLGNGAIPGRPSAAPSAHGAEHGGGSSDKESREQARGAALQAQAARAVGVQRNIDLQRGLGNGNANGNANGRSSLSTTAHPGK